MKLLRFTAAIVAILGAGLSSWAFAIDLYVDTKTEQIYAKPGPGRVHMGSFVKEDTPAQTTATTPATLARTGEKTADIASEKAADIPTDKTDAAELTAVRRDIELKSKMMGARLASDLASLEERVKDAEKVHTEFHDGGPHFASKDGNFTFAMNGRIQAGSEYNLLMMSRPPPEVICLMN